MVRVLVIDRDDAIRETLYIVLEDAGYEVSDAADATTALAFLRDCPQCVVVLFDTGAPGRQADEFFSAVAASNEWLRLHAFICLTTYREKLHPDLRAQFAYHAIPILDKPFDLDALLAAVDAASKSLAARGQVRLAPQR
jgi:CheY-like chemotaxis protein